MSEDGLTDFVLQTLFRPRDRGAREMSIIGVVIGLVLLIIVVPLLPVLVVLWAVEHFVGGGDDADEVYTPAH